MIHTMSNVHDKFPFQKIRIKPTQIVIKSYTQALA